MVRLSININDETAEVIRRFQERRGCNATEAVRQLIGYGSLTYFSIVEGSDVLIRHPNGDTDKVVPEV